MYGDVYVHSYVHACSMCECSCWRECRGLCMLCLSLSNLYVHIFILLVYVNVFMYFLMCEHISVCVSIRKDVEGCLHVFE